MPMWSNLSFQDANSPTMEQMMFFHDHVMLVLVLIMVAILHTMFFMMKSKIFNPLISEGQMLESVWTLTPSLVLILIAFPSMKVLYMTEDSKDSALSVKVTGHQWYWSYEHPSQEESEDSFMEESTTLRLLKCSSSMTIPSNVSTQVVVTSADVIHAWTVPSMSVKIDSVPGRLNQTFLLPKKSGFYSGQCSEICGANHSFMPILLESMPIAKLIEKIK